MERHDDGCPGIAVVFYEKAHRDIPVMVIYGKHGAHRCGC